MNRWLRSGTNAASPGMSWVLGSVVLGRSPGFSLSPQPAPCLEAGNEGVAKMQVQTPITSVEQCLPGSLDFLGEMGYYILPNIIPSPK